jgi:branched-chain amino acid transport system permease protein
MGSQVLIMCFVVVVIGGIGSVRGALIAALLVGLVDTFGKVLLPQVAGMLVYMLMAAVLLWKPEGCSSNEPVPIPPRSAAAQPAGAAGAGPGRPARLCPFVGTDFYAQMVARMMILAIFAMSLDLLQGVTGLVSLGHAAFFGIGGYALALRHVRRRRRSACGGRCRSPCRLGARSRWSSASSWSAPTASTSSWSPWRSRRWCSTCSSTTRLLGGSDGIYINFKPDAGVFDLENKPSSTTSRSPAGAGLPVPAPPAVQPVRPRAGRHPRQRAPHARLGFGTFGYKLAAFTLAGALAGLAGYLWGAQTGFVNPELMGFHMSAHAIMMVILGGMGNFAGAIAGAFAFEYLLHVFKDLPDRQLQRRQALAAVDRPVHRAVVVTFAPRGLLGVADAPAAPQGAAMSMSEPCCSPRAASPSASAAWPPSTTSRWTSGGPHPRRDRPQRRRQVDADQPALRRPAADRRQRHAGGRDVTGWSPERISRAGLGRSYQKTNIFLPFTVWENVRLAAQSRTPHAAAGCAAPARAASQRAGRTRAGTRRPARRAAMPSPAPSATASSASSRSR